MNMSLSYRNKVAEYFTLFVFALFLPKCSARFSHVNESKSATWNTNGPRWDVVKLVMISNSLDVFAIQEAGSIRSIDTLSTPTDTLPFCYDGYEVGMGSMGVKEQIWGGPPGALYLYYYDNTQLNNGTRKGTPKQNMAIVTKVRASEVMLISPKVTHESVDANTEQDQARTFINRPALGIRMGTNSVFFNIHAEPVGSSNEAPALISAIESYAAAHYPRHTWMVMGDFNRTPGQLQLPAAHTDRFIAIVQPQASTRGTRILDYAVVGGPATYRANVVAMTAQLLQLPVANPSDHAPVRFN